MLISSLLTNNFVTVISLCVSVPVLSEQMTVHAPNVSALGSFLIRAFFLAILWTPIANDIVTTAGRPSGIAATAMAIAARSISRAGFFAMSVP